MGVRVERAAEARGLTRRLEPSIRWAGWGLIYLVVGAYCATSLFALLWAVYTSFKTDYEVWFGAFSLPGAFRWEHYQIAWVQAGMSQFFFNSVYISILSVVGVLLVSSMGAYVLARIPFRFNRVVLFYLIAGMMVPGFLYLLPLYLTMYNLKLTNSHLGLILLYITGSLSFDVFILTGFFKTLPAELEESSALDGSGAFSTFFRVMLPLAQPGLLTVAIFNFLGFWNEFFLALIFLHDAHLFTLSVGLQQIMWRFGVLRETTQGVRFAGLVIAMVPTIIAFILLQDRITRGLTVGALKG